MADNQNTDYVSPEEESILLATIHNRTEKTFDDLWSAGFRSWSWERITRWRAAHIDSSEGG